LSPDNGRIQQVFEGLQRKLVCWPRATQAWARSVECTKKAMQPLVEPKPENIIRRLRKSLKFFVDRINVLYLVNLLKIVS
jgi:hypothetical protein